MVHSQLNECSTIFNSLIGVGNPFFALFLARFPPPLNSLLPPSPFVPPCRNILPKRGPKMSWKTEASDLFV